MKKILLGFAVLGTVLTTSCSKDDDNGAQVQVVAPSTYTFTRNGNSTVSFSGQTTRIKMAEELVASLLVTSKTEAQLDGMFTNTGNNFADAALNSSSKTVRSKTAASKDYFSANTTVANMIKGDFDNWIAKQVSDVYPKWGVTATAGNAGQLQEVGGGSTRYINEKGLEYNQAFAKSLIGALMVDQMLNNYLSTAVLDDATNVADNNNGTVAAGKPYTTMEHKWDEAYGYLYGKEANAAQPVLGADAFLNKYLKKVNDDTDFAGIKEKIFNAFKLGRAAIVAKKYDIRNGQAELIREEISKVLAIRAVYYLQKGKADLAANKKAKAFHNLSEGYGFIYSLQFTRKPNASTPYFSKAEVDGYINQLMANQGFWSVTSATLDSISNSIAAKFSFTVAQAAN